MSITINPVNPLIQSVNGMPLIITNTGPSLFPYNLSGRVPTFNELMGLAYINNQNIQAYQNLQSSDNSTNSNNSNNSNQSNSNQNNFNAPLPLLISTSKNRSTILYNNVIATVSNNEAGLKNMIKYYYYKTLDKWLYKDLFPLLAYLQVRDDKIRFIKSLEDYDINELLNDTEKNIERRADFFEDKIISKKLIKHILNKVMKKKGIDIRSLKKYENTIKKYLYEYITSKFNDKLEEY
jgi:hypothetical protein